MINLKELIPAKKETVLLLAIFLLHLFLRFSDLDTRSPFGWDQVNNAWAAKSIIVDHNFPQLGFQAKGNSGVYIGPLYYYLIAIVYAITNLDPIASGIFAGVTSIFTFFSLYVVAKKLFNYKVAILAVFINTVNYFGVTFDRWQVPVNFIPGISLIIFYSLYKIMTGNYKYLILLGFGLGFSLHIHITSLYYFIITLLSLPFFPWSRKIIRYVLVSVFVLILFSSQIIIAYMQNIRLLSSAATYQHSYFHGIHLKRILQLTNDAFIQFEPYLFFRQLFIVKFILVPIFIFTQLKEKVSRSNLIVSYLIVLFFVVPWVTMSVYSGEISDYYYSSNRFIALIILSYLLYRIIEYKNIVTRGIIAILLAYYSFMNLTKYETFSQHGIQPIRNDALREIKIGGKVGFYEGDPLSYVYYYYMYKKGKRVF